MFKVGETVVHKTYGVGIIKGIEKREFTKGNLQQFYILNIVDDTLIKKVFVPFQDAQTRIRALDKAAILKVYSYLLTDTIELVDGETWNRRYRNYMELIHSGQAMDVAKVYKSLRERVAKVDASFGERKLLDQARNLLIAEFKAVGVEFPE